MTEGIIIKALSGFYYVETPEGVTACKARGRFRLDGTSPLVGDRVRLLTDKGGSGRIEEVLERKNFFIRPAVANVDTLVFIAANVNPVTDPFLIDRVAVIAHEANCELIVCVNKIDLDKGDDLYGIYTAAGYPVIRTSAETGEGAKELLDAMRGKVCAFTGNSGVGKSRRSRPTPSASTSDEASTRRAMSSSTRSARVLLSRTRRALRPSRSE